jgi:hypothetical protein
MPLRDDQDRIAALEAAQQELKERVAYLEGRLTVPRRLPMGPLAVPREPGSALEQVMTMAKDHQRQRLVLAVDAGLIDQAMVTRLMKLWYPE